MNNGFVEKFDKGLNYKNDKKCCNITTNGFDKLKKIKKLSIPNKNN